MNKQKRNKIIVVIIAIGLIVIAINTMRLFTSKEKTSVVNTQVVYKKGNITVFGKSYKLFVPPDRIKFHGNYLLIRQSYLPLVTVYNLETGKVVFSDKNTLIDYDGKNKLYSTSDLKTIFNTKKINLACIDGFIQNDHQVYCITPKTDDLLDNKLVVIDPNTGTIQDVYSSHITLHSIVVISNKIYISGFMTYNTHPYIIVNGKESPISNRADVIFKENNTISILSFESDFNKQTPSLYLLHQDTNGITTSLIDKGEIVIYGRGK